PHTALEARRGVPMSPVYIRELRTEITEGATPAPFAGTAPDDPREAAERAAALARREHWLATRVSAEGFDD
ncbi:hypothetical protein PU560_05125, partial [Georgenia sp. 10Sc9-8]|nr:hypothetical protein [Georgenia halotolerans]